MKASEGVAQVRQRQLFVRRCGGGGGGGVVVGKMGQTPKGSNKLTVILTMNGFWGAASLKVPAGGNMADCRIGRYSASRRIKEQARIKRCRTTRLKSKSRTPKVRS